MLTRCTQYLIIVHAWLRSCLAQCVAQCDSCARRVATSPRLRCCGDDVLLRCCRVLAQLASGQVLLRLRLPSALPLAVVRLLDVLLALPHPSLAHEHVVVMQAWRAWAERCSAAASAAHLAGASAATGFVDMGFGSSSSPFFQVEAAKT